MSYDLMVFRKEAAPRNRADFLRWYNDQTEWKEGHTYEDPANTSPELRNWFLEMIRTFPAMNGQYATVEENNPNVADYSIGRDVIYVAFAWSVVEEAFQLALDLSAKHSVGLFDVSGGASIFFPEKGGEMVGIDDPIDHEQPVESILNPGRYIQNFVGASVRWTYGSVWRRLTNKQRYSFAEYMYGPKDSDDWFDQKGHTFVNRTIGLIFMVVVFAFIFKSC